jgi:hypothetical protein
MEPSTFRRLFNQLAHSTLALLSVNRPYILIRHSLSSMIAQPESSPLRWRAGATVNGKRKEKLFPDGSEKSNRAAVRR